MTLRLPTRAAPHAVRTVSRTPGVVTNSARVASPGPAENVYYESRGEPLMGQYAVAEVTMNRVASPEFPDSVCAVVRAKGAFSWTYAREPEPPYGFEWRRARAVASSVYGNVEAPLVDGALFYHATYVSPDWATSRRQVALLGRHLFYL